MYSLATVLFCISFYRAIYENDRYKTKFICSSFSSFVSLSAYHSLTHSHIIFLSFFHSFHIPFRIRCRVWYLPQQSGTTSSTLFSEFMSSSTLWPIQPFYILLSGVRNRILHSVSINNNKWINFIKGISLWLFDVWHFRAKKFFFFFRIDAILHFILSVTCKCKYGMEFCIVANHTHTHTHSLILALENATNNVKRSLKLVKEKNQFFFSFAF